jgi:hypothetical protein
VLSDQLGQVSTVDLDRAWTAHLAWGGLAAFAPALLDPADPGRADHEDLGDLLGGHAAVGGGEDAVTQVLGVCGAHRWLLGGPWRAIARSYTKNRASATGHAPNLRYARSRAALSRMGP